MKVVLLAGGLGTRLSEETGVRPKPMIEIGGKPILWHIMKIYSWYGFNEFVICLGYKGYIIKEYFSNYFLHMADVTIDMSTNTMSVHHQNAEPWKVTLVDTGVNTMTGGRIKRIQHFIGNERFMLTYGDGVADINIRELVEFHEVHGRLGTICSVQPAGRFGALEIGPKGEVTAFREKQQSDSSWVNGGFFILEPAIFDCIGGDTTVFEREPLEQLAARRELVAFKHYGFWKPMDTMRDKIELDEYCARGNAPWMVWND
jgi:glucose-1-phosphate cytidylyltransferase